MVMSVILVVFFFFSIFSIEGLSWQCTRKCLVSLFTAAVSVGVPVTTRADVMTTVTPSGSGAPSISSIREGISTGASMVPGFGPKDVMYPRGFEGKWVVTQNIKAIEDQRKDPRGTVAWVDALLRRGPSEISFERSYIAKEDGSIVLERAGAATNFYNALQGGQVKSISQWDQSNPNLLTTTEIFAGSPDKEPESKIQESKVTKRSQESASTTREISQSINADTQVGYSEFSRISEEDLERDVVKASSVPKVIGSRLLARYKYDPDSPVAASADGGLQVNKILGVERLYIYPGNVLDLGSDKPDIVVKSTVSMVRK